MRFLSKFYKIWFAGLFKSENEMGRMSLECTKNPCIAVGILYLYQFIYKLLEMPAAFLKVLVEAVACGGGAEYHAALCKP